MEGSGLGGSECRRMTEMQNPLDWKKKAAVFLASQNFSMFGSMLVQYAILWHITLTTQSGSILTISTVCAYLPQIVISLFAGVWADRYDRKRLIIAADLLTAVSTLILAILFLLGYGELWLLFVVSAIRSVGGGIQAPAVSALLPQIVPSERLLKVNSINGTIQPFMMIVSPIAAGGLMAWASVEGIFFVDVITAAIAVGLLLGLKVAPHARAAAADAQPKVGYLDDLKAGVRYIGRHRAIKILIIFNVFVLLLVGPAAFLTPLLVARSYGEEVWRLTANEVAFFGGMILGGLLMTAWGGFKNHFRTIGLGTMAIGLFFAGLGTAQVFPLYLAVMFLAGIPLPLLNVPTTTLLQEMVEPEFQGRVFSVMGMISSAAFPASLLIFGPLSDAVRIETLLIITGIGMMLPGAWIFLNKPHPRGEASLSPAD